MYSITAKWLYSKCKTRLINVMVKLGFGTTQKYIISCQSISHYMAKQIVQEIVQSQHATKES